FDDAQVAVQSTGKGEDRVVLAAGMAARFLSSGHIVFGNHGALLAAALDSSQRRLTAPPVPVVKDVMINIAGGIVEAAFADTAGTLAYVPAVQPPRPERLVLVDRAAHAQILH